MVQDGIPAPILTYLVNRPEIVAPPRLSCSVEKAVASFRWFGNCGGTVLRRAQKAPQHAVTTAVLVEPEDGAGVGSAPTLRRAIQNSVRPHSQAPCRICAIP